MTLALIITSCLLVCVCMHANHLQDAFDETVKQRDAALVDLVSVAHGLEEQRIIGGQACRALSHALNGDADAAYAIVGEWTTGGES